MKIYFLVTIDTECDKGPNWMIQKPLRFESVIRGIPELLTPLFKAFEVKPTYLLSPEVIQDKDCVKTLQGTLNCELGTHLHGEFIEPEALWDTDRTRTPQLLYRPEIEKKKLENLTYLFVEKFGYCPTSFRAGRWGMSQHTLPYLEELGYKVDSSICPFRTHYFTHQKEVNFWGSHLQPYNPSKNDYRKKGAMKIVEVPATLGNPHLIYWPNVVLRHINDGSRVHKKILGKLGKKAGITWLRPFKSTAKEMISLSESFIERFGKNRQGIYLNMMFHSNEIIPGASPYVQTRHEQALYIESMQKLFEYLAKKYELQGIGLSDVTRSYPKMA